MFCLSCISLDRCRVIKKGKITDAVGDLNMFLEGACLSEVYDQCNEQSGTKEEIMSGLRRLPQQKLSRSSLCRCMRLDIQWHVSGRIRL